MTAPALPAHGLGRIGPNVLIQAARALEQRLGRERAGRILVDSTQHTLDTLPSGMVDEARANALMRRLVDDHGIAFTRSVMHDAGTRTGDYLLAHRIPRAARLLLPLLPTNAALRLLLNAIGRHTWTFAGSAHVRITSGNPAIIAISRCPLCAGILSDAHLCDFYTGTFTRLARVLLGPTAFAEEVACESTGDSACRFLIGTRGQRMVDPVAKSYIVTRRSR
jgi:divinyl protochlorophyllide a 8-vinyl-reductase